MSQNPYQSPAADVSAPESEQRVYAGFWIRYLASIIDSLLMMFIIMPVLFAVYGDSLYMIMLPDSVSVTKTLMTNIFPILIVIIFWVYKSATPGKMILKIKIIDEKTGNNMSAGQSILRYFSYFISMLPFFLGFIWAGFDAKKQAWHDKIAGTVCIKT